MTAEECIEEIEDIQRSRDAELLMGPLNPTHMLTVHEQAAEAIEKLIERYRVLGERAA